MATERYVVCASCEAKEWAGRLFDALNNRAMGEPPLCQCGSQRYLEATFPFALGAGVFACKVIGVFRPEWTPDWKDDDGNTVIFRPFLVIGELLDQARRKTAWLPYWHEVAYSDGRVPKMRYGQWAPHMDADILDNLIQQARKAGFLT